MRRVTEQVTLTVGGPIDATMAALFARVTIESSLEGAPRGQAVVAVSAEDLQRINPTPNAYISPQAVGAPASEIGGLAVGRAGSEAQVALERGRSGWELQGAAAGVEGGATVSEARGQAVDEAVRLMCEAPAGAVLIEPPAGYEPQVTVELQSLGGSPLEIVDVGDMPAPQQAKQRFLVIRTRQTYRVYESSALGTLELLADLAGQAGAPSGHEAPAAEQMDEARDELPVGG